MRAPSRLRILRIVLVFVILELAMSTSSIALQVQPSQQSGQESEILKLIESKTREEVAKISDEISTKANRALEMASVILDVMRSWIMALSLMFVIFLAIGLREVGLLRATSAEASSARNDANASVEQ